MLDQELITEILGRADIVDVISSYINVVKKGKNYAAICPFHDDKNPSLMISKEKQIYKCFVCQNGGNAITFIQNYENIGFEDAVRKLAELINFDDSRLHMHASRAIDETKVNLYKTISSLSEFYSMSLYANEGKEGLNYLTNRHLDEDIIKKFGIGFCPSNQLISIKYMQASGYSLKDLEVLGVAVLIGSDYIDKNANRVIFPLKDHNGQVVGFSARTIKKSDEAKYVNSPETPIFHKSNVLYNYDVAKKIARLDGYVYVLEGFMDVIALSRIKINSAVALMGTAMSKEHVEMLRRLNCEIRLCLDGDSAGQMATMKCIELFDRAGLKYRVVKKDDVHKDVDEMLEKKGQEYVLKYINLLLDKLQFTFKYYKDHNPLETLEQRKKFVMDLLPIVHSINSTLEVEEYLRNLAQITKFSLESIKEAYRSTKNAESKAIHSTQSFEFAQEKRALSRLMMMEKNLLYQILNDPNAVTYYCQSGMTFSSQIYRQIANYILEYKDEFNLSNVNALIACIENSDDKLKAELIAEITQITLEKNQPPCSKELLDEYRNIITEERIKIQDNFKQKESLKGKSDVEKLKILSEFNRRKNEKLNAKSNKEE